MSPWNRSGCGLSLCWNLKVISISALAISGHYVKNIKNSRKKLEKSEKSRFDMTTVCFKARQITRQHRPPFASLSLS
jgi:quercetin dioxygenase-like cupin family protein